MLAELPSADEDAILKNGEEVEGAGHAGREWKFLLGFLSPNRYGEHKMHKETLLKPVCSALMY